MVFKKGCKPWNAGLKSSSDERVAKYAKTLSDRASHIGHPHSEETKKRLSTVAKEAGYGGYKMGSGRGKKGWYKGFFCDSSWELAFVIYNLDHKIPIERNKEIRYYEWEGETKRYIPDFIVDGKLVEIKGYRTAQWEQKLLCNPDVQVYYEEDLKTILEYVISRYGSEFVKLYETRMGA